MGARWPYVLALVFAVAGIGMTVYAPIAATIYGCLPALAFAVYRAFSWRSPFRIVLAVALVLFASGLLSFALTIGAGLLAGSSTAGFIVVELTAFAGILALPVVGSIVALVGLVGALARPGTRPVKMRIEPVGGF